MRVTLEYDLPSEKYEFNTAIEGPRMRTILETLDSELRKRVKFDPISNEAKEAFDWARSRLLQLCEEYNVHLYGGIE